VGSIDKLMLLEKMKEGIGRKYSDGIQVLTYSFEIQDDSRLTAVVNLDVSLNNRANIMEILKDLTVRNKISFTISDAVVEKLKWCFDDEAHKIRSKIKKVLDV